MSMRARASSFSIATAIFPGGLFVGDAKLSIPEGAQTPVAVDIRFESPDSNGPLTCSLDWRRSEGEEWTIAVRTGDDREIRLSDGGAKLSIDGAPQAPRGIGEYPDIYRRFVELIDERRSDVDVRPLRLVADCLLVGSRESTDALT